MTVTDGQALDTVAQVLTLPLPPTGLSHKSSLCLSPLIGRMFYHHVVELYVEHRKRTALRTQHILMINGCCHCRVFVVLYPPLSDFGGSRNPAPCLIREEAMAPEGRDSDQNQNPDFLLASYLLPRHALTLS